MGERDRAEKAGHIDREFWSRRPLADWCKSSKNKTLCRRIERHTAKRAQPPAEKEE